MSGTLGPSASMAPRRAGTPRGPALWFVHALGDSGLSFVPLFTSGLCAPFQLLAPDWPGAGEAPVEPQLVDLDDLAEWLARGIDHHTPAGPVGLVGHSLGSAVAVRAVSRVNRVVGLFSIEGNLTAADAYFSGLATAFEAPEEFRDHLLARVRSLAEHEAAERSEALWHYHASLRLAAPETLWKIARSAHASSRRDGLGEEYRALSIPSLYYWSRDNTPRETQEYIHEHRLDRIVSAGGHWPMIEQPQETASQIAAFFRPLFLAYEVSTHP